MLHTVINKPQRRHASHEHPGGMHGEPEAIPYRRESAPVHLIQSLNTPASKLSR